MATIYDVDPMELINKAAEELKKINEISPPEWAAFVKTGPHNERPPVREDWWYVRAAAILRKIYGFGPVGVNTLRKKYGGRKNRGVRPDGVRKASGNIIRKILQQLETAGLLEKAEKGIHKGRMITGKGKSFLDKASSEIYKEVAKQRKIDEEIEKEEQARMEAASKAKVAESKKSESEKAPEGKPVHKQEIKKEQPKAKIKEAPAKKEKIKETPKTETKKE